MTSDQGVSALRRCTWCGHVHDPEDGRCDSHAHVGLGRCSCPGDARARRLLPLIDTAGASYVAFDEEQQ